MGSSSPARIVSGMGQPTPDDEVLVQTCTSVRMHVGVWLVLSALSSTAIQAMTPDYSEPQSHSAQRAEPEHTPGEEIFVTCTRCHGGDGLGTRDGAAPAIAGQYARVIISELVDFRTRYANRQDPRMNHIADLHLLSQPHDLAEIAYYVSTLPRGRVAPGGSGQAVQRGKSIYQTACAGCHGVSAQGQEPRGVPWLASQHYEYLRREILYTLDHRRPNMEKTHGRLFQPLSQQDVDGLADYLSRLPPM